jgi:SRSO17 transposase
MLWDAGPTIDLAGEAPRVLTPPLAGVGVVMKELGDYHAALAPLFPRREHREWAEVYLRGLLVADVPRKNIEAIALRLGGPEAPAANVVRGLQQFVGRGAWDDAPLLAAHRRLVAQTLGEDDGVLIIDGSDFPKQGEHSVGVARQWSGRLGKRANCQVGVFLGYASRKGYTLVDRRLYLPESWLGPDQEAMREECRIPPGLSFQTKPELAAELVERVLHESPIPARWVVCDEDYGKDPALLDRIAGLDRWYLAEVACHTMLWPLLEPDGQTPRACPWTWVLPPAGKGRPPTKERLHPDSPDKVAVDAWVAQLPAAQWRRYRIVEGSKGPLVADFVAFRALAVRDGLPGPEVWVLARRKVSGATDGPAVKFYLSNAPADVGWEELVRVSGMRWPIESCFTEGKGYLGMDHYELRSWPGWHHHMTLVLLAHHFLVRLQNRLGLREGAPEAGSRPLGRDAGDLPGRLDRDIGDGTRVGSGGRDPAEPRPSMHGPPCRSATAGVRPKRGVGRTPVPATSQSGCLPLPSQTEAAALG